MREAAYKRLPLRGGKRRELDRLQLELTLEERESRELWLAQRGMELVVLGERRRTRQREGINRGSHLSPASGLDVWG
jgi:hypothetical protein